jgi:hypothetical protein
MTPVTMFPFEALEQDYKKVIYNDLFRKIITSQRMLPGWVLSLTRSLVPLDALRSSLALTWIGVPRIRE